VLLHCQIKFGMKKLITFGIILAVLVAGGCQKQDTGTVVTEQELKEAFHYTFPLMIMDATMALETNTVTFDPELQRAPVNQINHAVTMADASNHWLVAPNVDTYYSRLWMDLSKEPLVLEFPDVKDRFCNIQVMDAWTNTVTVIYDGGTYVFAKKGTEFNLPGGATLVEMPTSMVWGFFRILNKGEGDYPNVKVIQDAMKVYPLSAYGNPGYVAPMGEYNAANDVNPVQKCMSMSLEEYFAKANSLMLQNPPLSFDGEIMDRLAKLGVGPGLQLKTITNGEEMFASVKATFYNDVDAVADTYKKSIGGIWSYYKEPIGDFGNAYQYRAAVALSGLGANPTYVAIYPRTDYDSQGGLLNGSNSYTLHFSSLPPVGEGGFWSITAYGEDYYLIDNPINRYNVNDRSDFKLNPDGSLDVTMSASEPQDGTYWLPTGNKGFILFMRLYLPDLEALESWTPPAITKKL